MEKIGLLTRERIIEDLKVKLENTYGYFFINFSKVNAFSFNNLRNNLKALDTQIFVTKNSLLKRTFENLGFKEAQEFIEAETGVVLVYDNDVVKTCKVLSEFTKENETLQLRGGFINKKKVTSKEMLSLAMLPPREVLLGRAVSGIASPLTGFLSVLNQTILKFVWTVEEIKNKKEKS